MKYTLDRFGEAIDALMARIDLLETKVANREKAQTFSKLVSRKELAAYLGVCEATVMRAQQRGIIDSIPIGSVMRYDLQKVVKQLQEAGELI